jgi:hypothetical protein
MNNYISGTESFHTVQVFRVYVIQGVLLERPSAKSCDVICIYHMFPCIAVSNTILEVWTKQQFKVLFDLNFAVYLRLSC